MLGFQGAKKLASLAKPWFQDARPFARQALLAYIDDGCARSEHKALVKRLFKQAEAAKDDELMAHFMVAFDRLSRRLVVTLRQEWDSVAGTARAVQGLVSDPLQRERLREEERLPEFTRVTRRYLARRAFRYFRRLGYKDVVKYRRVVLPALSLYRDEDLNTVGRLLSAWGLLHVLYGRSSVIERRPSGVRVTPGRTLAGLLPAPIFPKAWEEAFDDVMALLLRAAARPVRSWAAMLLRSRYATELSKLGLAQVKRLALSQNEEAQVLGTELFSQLQGLEKAGLEDWLELLGAENLDVLSAVCDRATNVVSGARLSLAQCVDLVLSPAAPLATL
ncbi:MAG TPA: hypothetical protein VMF89_19245, partial [Polyangiales bacterium]|nr:hypothetical protein [Polyangiales bacterium]